MNYTLLVYETEDQLAAREDPKRAGPYWASWMAYSQALTEAGVLVSGAGLQPPATSTTVRSRGGKRQVQDGPFADTKERLGGFYVINVPSLDQALEWATRCPAASTGSVEVRPNMIYPPPGA